MKYFKGKNSGIENITIERAQRTEKLKRDGGTINKKRTVVVKFLYEKDKERIFTKCREKQMWNQGTFINKTFWVDTVNIIKAAIPEHKRFL